MPEKPTTVREAPEAVELSRGALLAALTGGAVPVAAWVEVVLVSPVGVLMVLVVVLVEVEEEEEELVKQLESPAATVKDPDHASVPSSASSATAMDSPADTVGVQVNEVPWMLSTSAKAFPQGLLESTKKAE
jgi:hypothetical protein